MMPEKEYKQFTEDGYFTIRRSHRFWSGIFSDQTIEQFLMRLLKTSGGMTRGRGITDSTLARWVHSLPQCVPICDALESFTSVHSGTSDQHRDLRPASQSRDMSDLCIFVQWLEAHPPFVTHEPDILFSLATGIVADGSVNCDDALHIGQCSMKKMTGKAYSEVTLHRKDRVKSLAAMRNTVKVRGLNTVINPYLMFNRITCVLNSLSRSISSSGRRCPDVTAKLFPVLCHSACRCHRTERIRDVFLPSLSWLSSASFPGYHSLHYCLL